MSYTGLSNHCCDNPTYRFSINRTVIFVSSHDQVIADNIIVVVIKPDFFELAIKVLLILNHPQMFSAYGFSSFKDRKIRIDYFDIIIGVGKQKFAFISEINIVMLQHVVNQGFTLRPYF